MKVLGYLIGRLVTQGMNCFVASWNNHCIRGPCKVIPEELSKNSPIKPLELVPSIEDLAAEYNFNGGKIKINLSDIEAFENQRANDLFYQ